MKLNELDELEKLFEVNIQVYNLAPTQSHGEEQEETRPDISATLLRHLHRHYESTLFLTLYENHFPYIQDLARYSTSFQCSRCGKYWKGANKLRRHEATCDGKVQLKYPGSAYHVPKTIFEELEDEGIIVPEEARYFPYRAIFNFKCYFDKEKGQELKNSAKLNWQSAHDSPSVLVCAVMCLSIKNRNVSCLTVTQKSLLQNLFSTWCPSAQKILLCCEKRTLPCLKRLIVQLSLAMVRRMKII